MDVDTAIAHLTRLWPEFEARIAGAPAERVSELEGLLLAKLPAAYRRFLERLGLDDGGLSANFGVTFSIDALITHYESPPWGVPWPYLCIGLDDGGGDPLFQTCLASQESPDPAVFDRDDVLAEIFWPPNARSLDLMFYGDDQVTLGEIAGRFEKRTSTVTDWIKRTEREGDLTIPLEDDDGESEFDEGDDLDDDDDPDEDNDDDDSNHAH